MGILKADNLVKIYGQGENEVKALNNVSLEIEEGEFVSIVVDKCRSISISTTKRF